MDDVRVNRARRLRREATSAETRLWRALRGHRLAGLHFRRQVPVGAFFADFVCRAVMLVIEVDGATHSTDAERARDARREAWLIQQGYGVLRFTNAEVYENLDGVLETIRLACEARCVGPPP